MKNNKWGKKIIQAWDVKPGDILYTRVKTNRWPETMTVKSVTLIPGQVKIMTTHGFVYNFAGEHTFVKELRPAKESELPEL